MWESLGSRETPWDKEIWKEKPRTIEITERLWVPDGWIVRTITTGHGVNERPTVAQTFVKDPKHQWDPKAEAPHS